MTTLTPRDALEVMREFWRRSDLISPTFDEAIAVLTALVERDGEPVAWMPIETAPKDGTYILVTNEEAGGSWVAKWESVYVSGFAPENPWMSMMLNTWHLPSRYPSLKPTLWQPLPAAPGASHER